MPIDQDVAALAGADNFAAFTTMLPSGHPMTHVMWVDCDDEHLLMNTEVHRQLRYGVRWWRWCGASKHAATSTS